MIDLATIQKQMQDVRSGYTTRDTIVDHMTTIYMINEAEADLPSGEHIKKTLSPDGRNAMQGAARLLYSTTPKWSVPEEMNANLTTASSTLERIAGAIWQAAGRKQGKPRQIDAVMSALLADMVVIIPTRTKDLVDLSSGAQKLRFEEIARAAPLVFDVVQPKACFPVFDSYGMSAFHLFQSKSVRDIQEMYGDAAKKQLGADIKLTDMKNLCEYWDYEQHLVWIDGQSEPILQVDNEWGFIPVAAGTIEGSYLFSKDGQVDCQPFLYTLYKSGMWDRQNLSLTVMYTQIFNIGANAQFVYQRNNPDKMAPDVDFSTPGGITVIDTNESFGPLSKQILDPSLMTGLDVATNKVTESTIYRQALGEPLSGNASFSLSALLSQAGRLPLVAYKTMTSHVIGEAMRIGLMMLKKDGGSYNLRDDKKLIELDAGEIPENLEIEATLDVDLPQDERNNAAIAMQLTSGDNPLLSVESARKRYFMIEQPEQETIQIWNERAQMARYMAWLQQQLAAAQQQAQMPQQPTPSVPGQMPAELMQQQQGNPMQQQQGMSQELSPEMMQQLAAQQGGMPNQQSTGASQGLPGIPLGGPLPTQGEPGMGGV